MDAKTICVELRNNRVKSMKIMKTMREENIYLVLDALVSNSSCIALDLSELSLSKFTASALARVLRRNTTLKTLKLNDCALDNMDLEILLAFEDNAALEELEMMGCKLEDVGLRVFARALKRNEASKLKRVNFCDNSFSRDAVLMLAAAVVAHGSVVVTLNCSEVVNSSIVALKDSNGAASIERRGHSVHIRRLTASVAEETKDLVKTETFIDPDSNEDPFFGDFDSEFVVFEVDESTWEYVDDNTFEVLPNEEFVLVNC